MALSSLASFVVFMVLLFLPAGTLNYWQGWAFLGTFAVASLVPTVFLGRLDPATVERWMHAWPTAETRVVQKAVVVGIIVCFSGMLVVSGFDHRFGWSTVPTALSVLGDIVVALGLGMAMRWWSSRIVMPQPTSSSKRISRWSPRGCTALCGIRCTPAAWS